MDMPLNAPKESPDQAGAAHGIALDYLRDVEGAAFEPFLNQDFEADFGSDGILPMTLLEVSYNPEGRCPDADRIPFSLLFRARRDVADRTARDGGTCHLGHPETRRYEFLLISRVMRPSRFTDQATDPAAYYEIILS